MPSRCCGGYCNKALMQRWRNENKKVKLAGPSFGAQKANLGPERRGLERKTMKRSNSQRGRMARNKGANGERELAKLLTRITKVKHIRAAQRNGRHGADIIPDDPEESLGIHWECKRTETFNLYGALDQAESDSCNNHTPVVCHRRNGQDWVFVCRLDDLEDVVAKLYLGMAGGA